MTEKRRKQKNEKTPNENEDEKLNHTVFTCFYKCDTYVVNKMLKANFSLIFYISLILSEKKQQKKTVVAFFLP